MLSVDSLPAERLAHEVGNFRAGLVNSMRTRRVHPSYGITKASLRERFAHLEAMLFAFGVVVDGYSSAGVFLQAERVASEHFGFDLRALRQEVESC